MVETSLGRGRTRRAIGTVAAAGIGLGGLVLVGPDAEAQAYGATCDLVLNTNAPPGGGGLGDPHWDAFAPVQSSMGDLYQVPIYISEDAAGGAAVSSPHAPTSSASNANAAGSSPGKVICVVGSGPAIINGTAGDDTIFGSVGNETINGMGGNDLLVGNGGNDLLIGKSGNDSLQGGDGDDILFGHVGRNQQGIPGDDTLSGGRGNDLIRGDAGTDLINGGSGDDCLLGGYGNDEVYGWDDNDTIGGGAGADVLAGNDNNDYIFGGKGNDTLRGNDGLDQIFGDSDLFDIGVEMTRAFVQNAGLVSSQLIVSMVTGNIAPGLLGVVRPAGAAPQSTIMTSSVLVTPLRRIRDVEAPNTWPPDITPMTTVLTTLGAVVGAGVNLPAGNYLGGGTSALTMSSPILGPITVPSDKLDTTNSSMIGGIEVSYATASADDKFFVVEEITLTEDLVWGAHTLVAGFMSMNGLSVDSNGVTTFMSMASTIYVLAMTNPGPGPGVLANLFTPGGPSAMLLDNFITVAETATRNVPVSMAAALLTNAWQLTFTSTMNGGPVNSNVTDPLTTLDITVNALEVQTALVFPHIAEVIRAGSSVHQKRGHLEVAACNLDAPRIMDDAFEISPTVPYDGVGGEGFTGLATLHMSMLLSSSRGDLEVPLLNDGLAGGPGPSGAFLGWPNGYDGGTFNDDIRGGDSDDLLFGEIGSDTIRGDHGDDTVGGEGDVAAWVLGDAVLNLGPAIDVFDLEVDGVPTFVYDRTRKVPIGVAEQYAGGAGTDSLSGNDDDDRIEGGGGDDHLSGGPDDDSLDGDDGADQIDGGAGHDACVNGFASDCEVAL